MYFLVNLFVRWALLLFSRQVVVEGQTKTEGPLLLVANHPNGFLDGIVIATRFRKPVYFLGRGDLFRHRFVWRLLKPLHLLPLYSAGTNLTLRALNEDGMQYCREVWKSKGIVLVFAEGETKSEWGLRETKKTAFRLADPVWRTREGKNLKAQALGIHYDSFRGTEKDILVKIGLPVRPGYEDASPTQHAALFQQFLRQNMKACLYAKPTEFVHLLRKTPDGWRRSLLAVPAIAGWVLHAALYIPAKFLVNKGVTREAFRESFLFLVLFIFYPLYWIGINVGAWTLFANPFISTCLMMMPLWARCYILWRKRPG